MAGAILVGGRGRRMGGAFKPHLRVGGQRIIDRQLAVLGPLFDALVIVGGPPDLDLDLGGVDVDIDRRTTIEVIADRAGPGLGPLAGLDAALAWLPPGFDAVVCVAGDMPYLAPALLQHLCQTEPRGAAAVVPRLSSGPQPLCARYHRSLGPLVTSELQAGIRAMHVFLERLQDAVRPRPSDLVWLEEPEARRLDPTLASFTNINLPADLLPDLGRS